MQVREPLKDLFPTDKSETTQTPPGHERRISSSADRSERTLIFVITLSLGFEYALGPLDASPLPTSHSHLITPYRLDAISDFDLYLFLEQNGHTPACHVGQVCIAKH